MAFIFAIEEINNNKAILPNITLGFHIYDPCIMVIAASESLLRIMTGHVNENMVPNYSCRRRGKVEAIVGHLLSSSTYTIAGLTSVYRLPQISYGALDSIFSDRVQFPSLYRTVPDEHSQAEAIVELLQHFGWNWVGMIVSEDDSSQRASEDLRVIFSKRSICIEYTSVITQPNLDVDARKAIEDINSHSANVIILYCTYTYFLLLVGKEEWKNVSGKIWITGASTTILTNKGLINLLHPLNGSIVLSVRKGEIPGLKEYLQSAIPSKQPDNIFIKKLWYFEMACRDNSIFEVVHNESSCVQIGKLKTLEMSLYDVDSFRLTYSIYAAVYAAAYALHLMLNVSDQERISEEPGMKSTVHPWQTPRSVCSDSCPPGYWKTSQEGKQVCCHICVRCADGEITSKYDMEACMKCPEEQWSNEKRDLCVPRVIDFLSYEDALCVSLALMAVLLASFAAGVLGIFIKHKDTAIVKANNRDLSYFLLVSILLAFLCTFLFLGRPINLTCLLRQIAFGIIFVLSLSSILAKTITVVIAFNATKPNSRLRKWVGPRVSLFLIILCTLGEVLICTIWLLQSPPFPDYDTKTESGKMILLCNEGSDALFYCVIGYMGTLALMSFFVAFLARKLPDSFNEAQHVSFSMLVFCSVWVSFIPAYISTKGRYMVAVEIFAILASSTGLLSCVFIPKCYIIIMRPDLNTKGYIIHR
ncbi:vomeronasal type-2 receptor 26-like [Lissotriton helveticus]